MPRKPKPPPPPAVPPAKAKRDTRTLVALAAKSPKRGAK